MSGKPVVHLQCGLYRVLVEGRYIGDLRLIDEAWRFVPLEWFTPIKGRWRDLEAAKLAVSSTPQVCSFAKSVRQDKNEQLRNLGVPKKPGRVPHRYRAGQVIGQRTVLKVLGVRKSPRSEALWVLSRCVCGKERETTIQALSRAEHCGCGHRPKPGEVFGARTVVSTSPQSIIVRCVCGEEQEVPSRDHLLKSYSCGCTKPPSEASGPKRGREYQRDNRRTNVPGYLLGVIRKRTPVKTNKVECTLTAEDIEVPPKCPILGTPFRVGKHGQKGASSPTVVRLDQGKGYVPGNIRVVSWEAAQKLERERLANEKRERLAKEAHRLAAETEARTTKIAAEERAKLCKELERPVYSMDIFASSFPYDIRLERALKKLGVRTPLDLMSFEPRHFSELPNVGRLTVKRLKAHMRRVGVLWPNPQVLQLLAEEPG